MEIVGEAVLSAALSTTFNKLASSDLLQFACPEEVEEVDDIKEWQKKLLKIHAVLEDAEETQMKNKLAKIWLRDLRDLAYDVEDILDEINTELCGKLIAEPQASTNKVQTLISSCLGSLISGGDRKVSRLKKITARLEKIIKEKNDLNLSENVGGKFKRTTERLPTTSVVDRHVRGREGDKDAIVELLLAGETSNNEFNVIPIVGMGGLGKTTLAQLVYNDARVKACFELQAWVCVSERFDIFGITKTILQSVTLETRDFNNLNDLQVELEKKLSKKKFLIVLDDVWNEKYEDWEALCKPFTTGLPGCTLVVTTRNAGVVSIASTTSAYNLRKLSDEDGLSLLEKHALGTRCFDEFPDLKQIGVEIVKKCGGLPLAVKTLGGLLRSKQNREEWEAVSRSNIWDPSENKNGILPALILSYHHLPSSLKRCFAYCSLFPKDHEFDKNELVSIWMAEGFVQPKGKKQIADLGCEYFDDLLSRSFFQQSSADESRYVMHDLINDLAQFVAEEVCFKLEDKESSEQYEFFEKARHSSLLRRKHEISKRFEVFSDGKRLRTFLALSKDRQRWWLSNEVVHGLLPKFKCLRALSLSACSINKLPNSIGDLKHLRYLNMSYSNIRQLPDSVSTLYNLQTLILCGCKELAKLPIDMKNLIDMHHLDITDTTSLQKMPPQIGNLTRLRILTKFIVGEEDELRIRELKELTYLQGQLSINMLDNVRDIQDARFANLKEKRLDELGLQWGDEFHDSRNEQDEKRVLNSLQPHQNLKKLRIGSYGGIEFPSWVGDPIFINIVDIALLDCRKSKSLPSLGRLPLLKHLYIRKMDAVERVGHEFFGGGSPFPSLETLKFEDMLEWKEWSCCGTVQDEAEFPRLRELRLLNCPKLIGNLPSHLPSLVYLNIIKCPLLEVSLERLPSLRELKLQECKEVVLRNVVDLPSLTTINMFRISTFTCLSITLMKKLVALEALTIEDCYELKCLWQNEAELENLACLRHLVIRRCPQLVSLAGEEEEEGLLPLNLEYLTLVDCDNLEKLPNGLHSLTCLKSLTIRDCPMLESLAGEEEGLLPLNLEDLKLEDCDNLEKLPNRLHSLTCLKSLTIKKCPKLVSFPETGWPYTLTHLSINDCAALEILPDGMMMQGNNNNQSLLEELKIYSCPRLKSFPRAKLPTMLKKLEIKSCENLESLPVGMMHDDNNGNRTCHLEELKIEGCSSLTSFPTGEFPATLKRLEIERWVQLESLSERMLQNHESLEEIYIHNCENIRSLPLESLHSLKRLRISNCPALESFSERGFSIPKLKSFSIYNCAKLKSLPSQMHNLTSLEELNILRCPSVVSFPEGGFPPNLTSLTIYVCENLKQPMTEWGLNTLTSLTSFCIVGPCPAADMVSFPDDDCRILPTTLPHLEIFSCQNLESLSRGFQNLTSLRDLVIIGCPKIWSLPKEGLPASLQVLVIRDCDDLKQRCLKQKGGYWPSIAHIPYIVMDGNHIQ